MRQLVDFKSSFSTSKLIFIWLTLISLSVFPWIISRYKFNNGIAGFAIVTNIVVLAIIIYTKISLKITIHPQKQIIEYFWVRLWGKKHQVSITVKNAQINLSIIRYQGNDLYKLIITDSENPDKKISLTEVTDGFDGREITNMYRVLKQVSAD